MRGRGRGRSGRGAQLTHPADVGVGQADLLLVAVVKLDGELARRLRRGAAGEVNGRRRRECADELRRCILHRVATELSGTLRSILA